MKVFLGTILIATIITVLFVVLSGSNDRIEVSRVPVPETDLTVVLTKDFKRLVSYQVFQQESPVSEIRLLGPLDSDNIPTIQVSSSHGVATIEWTNEHVHHFVKIAIAERKILSDSNPADRPATIRQR